MAKSKTAGSDDVNRIRSAVGYVREHTIEIGSTVIWIDNIGSIQVVVGNRSWLFLVIGALAVLAGLNMLKPPDMMPGVALLAIGGALIYINLNQKVDAGLSIGTTDGRRTLLVSTNHAFLANALEFLRAKIDSGSAGFQGTINFVSSHIDMGGGSIAVGDGAIAVGAQSNMQMNAPSAAATAPMAEPMRQWTPPREATREMTPEVSAAMAQARALYQRGAEDVAPRLARFMQTQGWPDGAPALIAALAGLSALLGLQAGVVSTLFLTGDASQYFSEFAGLAPFGAIGAAAVATLFARMSEGANRPLMLGACVIGAGVLSLAAGAFPRAEVLAPVLIAQGLLGAVTRPVMLGIVGDKFGDSNRTSGVGAILGGVMIAAALLAAVQGWAFGKFGAANAAMILGAAAVAGGVGATMMLRDVEREEVHPLGFGAVWRRIFADPVSGQTAIGWMLASCIYPGLISTVVMSSINNADVIKQYGLVATYAPGVGLIGGAIIADIVSVGDARRRAEIGAIALAGGAASAVAVAFAPSALLLVLMAAAVVLVHAPNGIALAAAQGVAGAGGRASAASIIFFLSIFLSALGLAPVVAQLAQALIGNPTGFNLDFQFPGSFVVSGGGYSQSSSLAFPLHISTTYASAADLQNARRGGVIAMALLLLWPAYHFYIASRAQARSDEARDEIVRGGPPAGLFAALGGVLLAAVGVFTAISPGVDTHDVFASGSGPRNMVALANVGEDATLTPAALGEHDPSALDRLYRMLPANLEGRNDWNGVAHAVFNYTCPEFQKCAATTQILASDGVTNKQVPGAVFSKFELRREDGGECHLRYGSHDIAAVRCANEVYTSVLAPPRLSNLFIASLPNSSGQTQFIVFDAARGRAIVDDDQVLPAGCVAQSAHWYPKGTRALVDASCPGNMNYVVLIDVAQHFFARASYPSILTLKLDFTSPIGEQHFNGDWRLYAKEVRAESDDEFALPVEGRLDVLRLGEQSVSNGISTDVGAKAWFDRLSPTATLRGGLKTDGLRLEPIGSIALARAGPNQDETQKTLDTSLASTYGAQPISMISCADDNRCWAISYSTGTPPSLAAPSADQLALAQNAANEVASSNWVIGVWQMDWTAPNAKHYRGVLQVGNPDGSGGFNATLTVRQPLFGQLMSVNVAVEQARVVVNGESVTIDGQRLLSGPQGWVTDNFYLTRQGASLSGSSLDDAGRRSGPVTFTR